MTHRYDIPLHRNLQSAARWHGKRVGRARATGDTATADYESAWYRRHRAILSPIEDADSQTIFYDAERRAMREGES